MMETLDEQPKGKQDYDQWISDGIVVGKSKFFRQCQSFEGMSQL